MLGRMGIDVPLPLSLFASGAPALAADPSYVQEPLDDTSWVVHSPGWLQGADELLATLADALPWTQSRRLMWGNWVDEPRLTCAKALVLATSPPVVRAMAAALSAHFGVTFDSCFCNYYRDGADSVAWHSDRDGKVQVDPLVAIVSLGGPRQFSMRPKDAEERRGTRARTWLLHSGDLLVMGGACQHRWEHAVPKTQHAAPRMSVTFRHRRPRGSAATAS
jgi:alkylated DNA repair dioxygenase AlkB